MEDIEKRRARCREYGREHRQELSAYRTNKYRTDEDFRKRCKAASKKWYEKNRKGGKRK